MARPAGWRRARAWVCCSGALLALFSGAALAETRCPSAALPPSPQQMQAAQRDARDHGLLWRLSKNGHDSYLFGTLHVGKLAWSFPGPTLRSALQRSDVLALELDVSDPALARQLQAAVAGRPAPALPDTLRARLEAQIAVACLPARALSGLHPVLQVLSLTLQVAQQDGLGSAHSQEQMLSMQARARGQRIVSLESIEQQLAVLLPPDAATTQALLTQALDALERGQVRPTLRRLTGAWAAGDLATLEQYPDWCKCAEDEPQRALLRQLNDERNAPLADGIDALHTQGHRVFAAVGALHMTGAQALPKLLAERGYTVRRIGFP